MTPSRPTNTKKPTMLYRISPEQPMVIDCKINDGRRRRWIVYKFCASASEASRELMRLHFAEMDGAA